MSSFDFKFDFSEPPVFREMRSRWLDEELHALWNRDQLNDELFLNELRGGFGPVQEDLIDLHPVPPSPTLLPNAGPSNVSQSFDQSSGYMEQRSAFALDSPPTESTFLESCPKGSATLTYQDDNDELQSIRGINVELIEQRSAILGMAFETGRSGPHLFLETLNSRTALPFIRYLYTGTYALRPVASDSGDVYEDVPTSVLFHCQMYRLADIYDLPDLKSQAYVNVLRQCEFGCSSPDKPIDLCAAIRFLYGYLLDHENLMDAIVNYCVSCFLQHRLAEDEEFKRLAFELRPFHQALCRNSMAREFENETASAIVQMPFKPYIPETYASREDVSPTKFDDVFHFHCNDRFDTSMKKRRRSDLKPKEEEKDPIVLSLRRAEETFESCKRIGELQDDDYKFGTKRRASSITNERAPGLGGASQPRVVNGDAELSEPDYDILERPQAGVVAYDSDSDSSAFVEVKREPVDIPEPLVIRTRAPPPTPAGELEDDPESDWTLL